MKPAQYAGMDDLHVTRAIKGFFRHLQRQLTVLLAAGFQKHLLYLVVVVVDRWSNSVGIGATDDAEPTGHGTIAADELWLQTDGRDQVVSANNRTRCLRKKTTIKQQAL